MISVRQSMRLIARVAWSCTYNHRPKSQTVNARHVFSPPQARNNRARYRPWRECRILGSSVCPEPQARRLITDEVQKFKCWQVRRVVI